MDMKVKKVKGTIFFILAIFGLIFSIEIPNSVAMGDIILRMVGLKVWSNETQGFHYTVVYSFVMVIIGYKGVTHYLNNIYPKIIRLFPIILVVIVILFSSINSTVNKTVKTLSKGINAVDYNRKTSSCDFKTDSYGDVMLSGNLQFQNFSNEDVKFYIKLIPDSFFADEISSKEPIIATNSYSNSPNEFILHSKSVQNFQVYFKTSSKNGLARQGNIQNLNIIIFNKDKEKQFIKN
ncbi:hypothetical protein [Clostridium thailandense]|uniref:hypothetical protein n=1 Tax=Clostridium thailandense TaxID=2794346 RepID=UPI0039892F85